MKTHLYALLLLATLPIIQVRAYSPPIGIPNPSDQFGWEIDRATPDWPAEWKAGTPSAVPNFYYVDKTAANATNTANPYGHPGLPRKGIPEGQLSPGAYIYVHAGTYTSSDTSRFDWYGIGTTTNPIWITGNAANRPVIQTQVQIGENGSTSFLVFENFEISGSTSAALRVVPDLSAGNGRNLDHILIRNIKRVGTVSNSDANGITIGISQSNDTLVDSRFSDIVVYNCLIYDVGATQDDHGIEVGYHTNRVWILDNDIHHVGGDSVQGSHYSTYGPKYGAAGDPDRVTEFLYIGRNLMYGNGENGIDIKTVMNFVCSQNTIYGPFAREQGYAIVAHTGFNTSYHPRNGAILFNNIYHCSGGVYTGFSSGVDNMDIIGNKFWDIKAGYAAQSDTYNGACIQIGGTTSGGNSVFRIVDNSMHDFDRGIFIGPKDGDVFRIHGNVFSGRTANASWHEFELLDSVALSAQAGVRMDYNLYTGTPSFRWRSAADGLKGRTLDYMKLSAVQEAKGLLTVKKIFADAANGDLHHAEGSDGIDVSVEGPVGDSAYAAHLARFGVPIKVDFDKRVRPVDNLWDIGAFESALPPPAPSELKVNP